VFENNILLSSLSANIQSESEMRSAFEEIGRRTVE
jgi:hypothetical protein